MYIEVLNWCWRDRWAIESMYCSSGGPEFSSQRPCWVAHNLLYLHPGHLTPSSGIRRYLKYIHAQIIIIIISFWKVIKSIITNLLPILQLWWFSSKTHSLIKYKEVIFQLFLNAYFIIFWELLAWVLYLHYFNFTISHSKSFHALPYLSFISFL